MVTNLKNMMIERLKCFKDRSKRLPERILVYRDGVSEARLPFPHTLLLISSHQGQFSIVVNQELPEIQAAIRSFNTATARYNPKITIVICGKRHHTRFYPVDESAADGNGNPKAGTVVDRGVTAVYEFDFFLQGIRSPFHCLLYFLIV